MNLSEAKQILNKNGYLVEKFYSDGKYIFKETDKEWFGDFFKKYDAYGYLDGCGAPSEVCKVYDYSDGNLTFVGEESDPIDFETFINCR